MARTRLTWSDRSASPAPALPVEPGGGGHPASRPDPDPGPNGDTSSWAEDPTKGPYPNGPHPALPGTEAPQGHPITDPAHYFPAGVGKQAAAMLQAAVQQKAAKCIRLAEVVLGKTASWSQVEDQALDFMNLSERQLQATAERLGNFTLTEGRKAEDAPADEKPAEEAKKAGEDEPKDEKPVDEKKAGEDADKDEDAGDTAAKKAAYYAKKANYWGRLASLAGEVIAGDVPEAFKKQWDKGGDKDEKKDEKPADEKKDEGDDKAKKEAAEAEALLASMLADPKLASTDDDEDDALLASMLEEEAKKAGGDKPADEKPWEDGAEKKAELDMSEESLLAGLLGGPAPEADAVADDFLFEDDDPMGLMDTSLDMGDLSSDDMNTLYGNSHFAGEEPAKADEEKAKKEASARRVASAAKQVPQPRTASAGVRVLGGTPQRQNTSEVADLSKIWETAPDVSGFFR